MSNVKGNSDYKSEGRTIMFYNRSIYLLLLYPKIVFLVTSPRSLGLII